MPSPVVQLKLPVIKKMLIEQALSVKGVVDQTLVISGDSDKDASAFTEQLGNFATILFQKVEKELTADVIFNRLQTEVNNPTVVQKTQAQFDDDVQSFTSIANIKP